jgi:hypothetical protein
MRVKLARGHVAEGHEGTSGHVGKLARGTPLRGQGDTWARWQGLRQIPEVNGLWV